MKKIDEIRMLEFHQADDVRGHLVVVEGKQDIPFEIKRIFFMYGSENGVVRGQHANRETEFVLINVAGKSKVKVIDSIGTERIYNLDRPYIGLYLPNMIWKEMYDFSENSVLLVLASNHYDSTEYIRDYQEFIGNANF